MAVTHRSAVLTATASAALLGAAVVHASVIDAHFAEWWAEGVCFLVLQVVELALALALVRRASRPLYLAAIAVSAGTVALWIVSRTVGVPVGPGAGRPEAVGRPDLTATVLELMTALVLIPLVFGLRVRARSTSVTARAGRVLAVLAAVLAVATVTASGVIGQGDAHGHGGHALGALTFGPGEYPLGEPLRQPTQSRGPGFYFAARPLRRVVLELGVGPATAGVNTFDVVVVDHAGNRIDLPRMSVTASLPGREPLRFRATRLAPGHFVVDAAPLTTAGTWRLLVEGQRRGRVVLHHAFAVPIGA
jgi:hypothetical protein